MATISQIDANRQNAKSSTGPRTEPGRTTSSRNALSLGLYTRSDYVKFEERDLYKEFCATMYTELCPQSLLEESLAAEITGASWRLRRCSAVEDELADYMTKDPMLDESTEKIRRSIERARSSAHSLLHRSINQLRRLQTDRPKAINPTPVQQQQALTKADLESLLQPPDDFLQNLDALLAEHASKGNPGDLLAGLGSFCTSAGQASPAASPNAPRTPQTPRNSACPCKSGQKYKRCCGRTAPPVLNKAA